MRADAILAQAMLTTSRSLASDPTQASGLTPIDQIRQQVAAALFGPSQQPATQVGRFQVQKLIGTGGMGVVFAATDPQLGRTVALKLLQPLSAGERARERLLREAQAMARLQHPNVVAVHEAGVHGDQVYLVMEYIEDGTLADWLRARPRSWQEVVGVLLQAGEGLAAAHAAGLVHRDFKPANILMGAGRARISDFGLARPATTVEELERTASEDDGLMLAAPLTRTGALLGTPAYMAPEQIRGEPATPASDQFAFGVVLYEALAGHRPFLGGSVAALLHAIDDGKLATPTRKLPPQLLTVLRRALAPDPARRYPDMPALLTGLRGVRALPARTRLLAVGASALLAGAGAVNLMLESTPPACSGDIVGDAWDAGRREQLAALPGAPEVLAALDAYADDLRRRDRQQCEAGGAALQWTATCLADRRTALADLTSALVTAPPVLHPGARAAVELLPPLADCDATPKYTALISEAAPEVRASVWQQRLGYASAFAPHAASRPSATLHVPHTGEDLARVRQDRRAILESNFANAVTMLQPEPESPPAEPGPLRLVPRWVPNALANLLPRLRTTPTTPPRDPLPRLLGLALSATEAGYADLAARSSVLGAELLETRPHSDSQRKQVWAQAEQALALLPAAHPLHDRLQRDLAYVQLTHARHVTAPGDCKSGRADFEACSAVFSATKLLTALTTGEAATPLDHELLARAHAHAGDAAAAAVAHAAAGDLELDERSLGYLDFSAAAVAPDGPLPGDSIRCNLEATACEIDRALAQTFQRDPAALFADVRVMASVKDGEYRGHKLYGIAPGSISKLLGFKNGDLIVAIDGAPLTQDSFLPRLGELLTRGEGTLELERKGERSTHTLTIR